MKTITLLNSKGGVGKSTLAVHIAAGLAIAGYKTILMDADMQANATTALGVPEMPHIYNLLIRPYETEWRDALTPVPVERFSNSPTDGMLFVCASNAETRSIANNTDDTDILADRLAEIEDYIDFVVFDTSPQADLMHSLIYGVTDYIVIPTLLERHSVEAVTKSLQRAHKVRSAAAKMGEDICKVIGIAPNMMRKNTVLHRETYETMAYEYGDLVWDALPDHIGVAEACLQSMTMYKYTPESATTEIMNRMMARLLDAVVGVTE